MITQFSQLDLTKRYSYADYLTWLFEERVELIKGWVMKMSPAPNRNHQTIILDLLRELFLFFNNNECKLYVAPFDVRLLDKSKSKKDQNIYTVVQPDICIICDEKKLDDRGAIGAPDLIIEILSPGNSKKDMKIKYELYEENEVPEYWIVNPMEKNLMQYHLKNKKFQLEKIYFDDDVLDSKNFKDLRIDLNLIFKNIN